MCACVYLVVGKVIVQRVFQFTKELLFFLFLSVFSLLEDRKLSKSGSVVLSRHCICDMKKCTFKNNNKTTAALQLLVRKCDL